jgi:PAS domain S-box-containing protein
VVDDDNRADVERQVARFEAILRSARDGLISIDASGRVTLFNEGAERMFGYAASEVLGRNVAFLMPEPYRREHDGYIRDYQQTGEARAIGRVRRVEGLRSSGERFPVELSVSEARAGDEVLYTAIIRDVSEVEQTRDDLDESRRALFALIANLPGAVYRLAASPGRPIDLVSEKIEDLTGYLPADFMQGKVVYADLVHPDDRERVAGQIREAIALRRSFRIEYRLRNAQGGEKWVRDQGRAVYDEEDRPEALEGFLADVSGQRRDRAEIERLRQLSLERRRLADIGALTSQIVHDLANPLAALSMVSQGILRRIERGSEATVDTLRPQVERLVGTAERLDALLADFRDFARVQRLDLQEITLDRLLASVEATWGPVLDARGISLEMVQPSQTVHLRVDSERLHRVFDNVVQNSIDAIGEDHGRLEIRAEIDGEGRLRIGLRDDGPGLPPERDVFGLFESTKPGGTGLGLPICRQILLAHGGDITAESPSTGGACFRLELPILGASIA